MFTSNIFKVFLTKPIEYLSTTSGYPGFRVSVIILKNYLRINVFENVTICDDYVVSLFIVSFDLSNISSEYKQNN